MLRVDIERLDVSNISSESASVNTVQSGIQTLVSDLLGVEVQIPADQYFTVEEVSEIASWRIQPGKGVFVYLNGPAQGGFTPE